MSSLLRRISSSGLAAHPFLVCWVEALSLCSTSQSSVGPGAGVLTLAEVICPCGDPGSAAGMGSPLAAARASLGIKPQDPKGEEGRRSESTVTPARDDTVQSALSGHRAGGAGMCGGLKSRSERCRMFPGLVVVAISQYTLCSSHCVVDLKLATFRASYTSIKNEI